MKAIRRPILWLVLVLLVGLSVWMSLREKRSGFPGSQGTTRSPQENSHSKHMREGEPDKALLKVLQSFHPPAEEDAAAALRALRQRIRSVDPASAARTIADFLRSGQDVATHLPFAVGSGGTMESVPTLRTALLDILPSMDPETSVDVAREVMDVTTSPDEFALTLRNLAWGDLDGESKEELRSRLTQMIENPGWRERPTAGFLEALDAAVEIGDAKAFDSMLRLNAGTEDSSLIRASSMVLDRMVFRDVSLLADSMDVDPGLRGIDPLRRASLASRLDPTVPDQRRVLLHYLADPELGDEELDGFARLFPNGNQLHGNWLITANEEVASIQARIESDRKMIPVIDEILSTNSTQRVNEALVRIRKRLEEAIQE